MIYFKRLVLVLILPIMLSGCKKIAEGLIDSALHPGSVSGSWHIQKIEKLNYQTNYNGLDFIDGHLDFRPDGTFVYASPAGEIRQGSWYSQVFHLATNDCYTTPEGNRECNTVRNCTVTVTVPQINGLPQKAAYYESISFTNDNAFTAEVRLGLTGYRYYFERD